MNGSALIAILATVIGALTATFLPRVEDPWPDTIGLSIIFTWAGAFAVMALAAAQLTQQPSPRRDAWVRYGTVVGFVLGAGFYIVALGVQVL